MSAVLPREWHDAMRQVALQTVQQHAASRAEVDALRQIVMSRVCVLKLAERAELALLLPALAVVRPGDWVLAVEVIGMALKAEGPAGADIQAACKRFMRCADPAKSLGKFLSRCIGLPVGGLYLERVEAAKPGESALYSVAGFKA